MDKIDAVFAARVSRHYKALAEPLSSAETDMDAAPAKERLRKGQVLAADRFKQPEAVGDV